MHLPQTSLQRPTERLQPLFKFSTLRRKLTLTGLRKWSLTLGLRRVQLGQRVIHRLRQKIRGTTKMMRSPLPNSLEIPENTDLLGIDPTVYRQINAALKSGKQHIMLYGPPAGTGKTTLARWIAGVLTGGKWTLVTGSSDWSSQDIIGGYQPIGDGGVAFIPGVLLRRFDRPLIIDELNRCDIDKVIGPLFTVLSGQQTTLPYRLNIEDKASPQYVILPESKPSSAEHMSLHLVLTGA